MLISLSLQCWLFSWHSLIFHNSGNSTLFDQNSLKLPNEFQSLVYLVFPLSSPPQTFQVVSELRLNSSVFRTFPLLCPPNLSALPERFPGPVIKDAGRVMLSSSSLNPTTHAALTSGSAEDPACSPNCRGAAGKEPFTLTTWLLTNLLGFFFQFRFLVSSK